MSRVRNALLAIAFLGGLAIADAQAQFGSGRGSAPSGGNAQGNVGGGASGAANPGGAGGVPNPAPGGFAPDAGSPGESAGPAGATARRPGYLGGRTTATGGVVTPMSADAAGAGAVPSDAYCTGVNPSGMSPSARLSEPNVERIDQAADAAGAMAGARSNRYLMANLQEELAKPAPDLELAGAYLGIAAGAPVTPEVVQRVTGLLCVPLGGEHARSVSAAAESQRGRAAARGR